MQEYAQFWATSWENLFYDVAFKGSDLTACHGSLIRAFIVQARLVDPRLSKEEADGPYHT